MKIKSSDEKITTLDVCYSDGIFRLLDTSGECISEYHPLVHVIENYDPQRFTVIILANKRSDYAENNIYQVKVPYGGERKRIGWIFPIQALESNEHEYSDDEHFLRYAYVALYNLLASDISLDERLLNEVLTLRDLYSMEETILIIDQDNISQIQGFDIDKYIVSLFSHGYSYIGEGNPYDSCEKNTGKYLYLKPISEALGETNYIISLFKECIPASKEPVSKFHLCYQIIELLISVIFNYEFQYFLYQLQNAGQEVDLFKRKERLDELINEKNRVKKLFSCYSVISTEEQDELKNICDSLLDRLNIVVPETVGESLYSVRCTLVHRCYMIDTESLMILNQISDVFCGVAIKMILDFRVPQEIKENVINREGEGRG